MYDSLADAWNGVRDDLEPGFFDSPEFAACLFTRRGGEARGALGYVRGRKGWRPRRWLSRIWRRIWRRLRGRP